MHRDRGTRRRVPAGSGGGERFQMFAEHRFTRGHAGQEFVGEGFGEVVPDGGKCVHKSVPQK